MNTQVPMPNTSQIVTITFFRYEGLRSKWWAFTQMGLTPIRAEPVPGLSFIKMLGSGGGNGFSIQPNFSTYGLLGVWQAESDARHFFKNHSVFQKFCKKSNEQWTVFMRTAKAHGKWDGQSPFAETTDYDKQKLVAVLTRATIYTKHLWRFWKFVPPVSRSIEDKKGLLFSVGVGELPIVQQATFSLWQNSEYMLQYAYKSHYHKEVVAKTRELGWYSEELFARFHPYDSEGSWHGQNPMLAAERQTF